MLKTTHFTVYIEQDEDGLFIGSIPSIASCYAQGKTKEEMLKNLQEVLQLCLRNTNKEEPCVGRELHSRLFVC